MRGKEASKIEGSLRTRCPITGSDGDMPTRTVQSQASAFLRIALLILAAAVFAWGLQYKLSLYKTGSNSHPLSVAKLMQGEQTNKKITAIIQAKSRVWFPQISLDYHLYAFRPPIIIRRNRQVDKLVYPSLIFIPCFLFVRPPPSI
jgi:hypothetical protein